MRIYRLCALFSGAALGLAMAVALALPRSAAADEMLMESRAMAFFDAYNTGDAQLYQAYKAEHMAEPPGPDAASRYLKMFGDLGRLEPLSVDFRRPYELTVGAQAEGIEDMLSLTFDFEPAQPFRILNIGIEVARSGGDGDGDIAGPHVTPDMTAEEMSGIVSSYLDGLERDDIWSGAVLIARNSDVMVEEARGLASRSFGVPNTVNTKFRVGSITKDFVDIAVARLIYDGVLDPDLTLAELLPDYPNRETAERITLRHLVTHRSGLGGMNYRAYLNSHGPAVRRPMDYVQLFAGEPLLFEPGTQREYSNAGYIVLGAVIEEVTGQHWEEVVRETVFEPAGMHDSGHLDLYRPHPGVAVGYFRCDPESNTWCNNYYWMEVVATPSGGSYSTLRDMLRFNYALRESKLLPPEWTRWFFSRDRTWPAGPLEATGPLPEVALAGGAEGVSAVLFSNGEWTVVVLSNTDTVGEDMTLSLGRGLTQ